MYANMHHPDICKIILVIEDYFMLVADNNIKCQIEPIIDDTNDDECTYGVRISRKLLNGYIHASIWGESQDSDRVIFNYSSESNAYDYLESIEIECSDYSTDAVRDAVRSILKIDKNATKQKSFCQ
jgi:hypothetical protein